MSDLCDARRIRVPSTVVGPHSDYSLSGVKAVPPPTFRRCRITKLAAVVAGQCAQGQAAPMAVCRPAACSHPGRSIQVVIIVGTDGWRCAAVIDGIANVRLATRVCPRTAADIVHAGIIGTVYPSWYVMLNVRLSWLPLAPGCRRNRRQSGSSARLRFHRPVRFSAVVANSAPTVNYAKHGALCAFRARSGHARFYTVACTVCAHPCNDRVTTEWPPGRPKPAPHRN